MNKLGVALAADSAVTVGGGEERKVYRSANKLFALSKRHPVGIMLYNQAEINGVPWEVLIKSFRRRLGARSFSNLNGYAAAFVRFVQADKRLFSRQGQQTEMYNSMTTGLHSLADGLRAQFRSEAATRATPVPRSKLIRIARDGILAWHRMLSKEKRLPGFGPRYEATLGTLERKTISAAIAHVFPGLPLDAALRAMLRRICVLQVTRSYFSERFTGLVIAGYGDAQLFPSMVEITCGGIVRGKLRYRITDRSSCDTEPGHEAYVAAFAQKEMVQAFMEGVSTELNQLYHDALRDALEQYGSLLISRSSLVGASRQRIERLHNRRHARLAKSILDGIQKIRQQSLVTPIMEAVAVLPKDELAEMAEALVSLTAFKRRVTLQLETVGGPIDVAVISKHDGFVWIKRKHYFKPELNLGFVQNYQREV